jgi:hypothetical protein
MSVICGMGMWAQVNGDSREYPWISARKDFYERCGNLPRFNNYALNCQFYEDMRDVPSDKRNCCECLHCVKLGGENDK